MIGEGREKKKRKRSIIVVLVHIHSLARFSPPFFLSFITRVMVSSAFNSQLTVRRQHEVSVSLIFPFFFFNLQPCSPACLPAWLFTRRTKLDGLRRGKTSLMNNRAGIIYRNAFLRADYFSL